MHPKAMLNRVTRLKGTPNKGTRHKAMHRKAMGIPHMLRATGTAGIRKATAATIIRGTDQTVLFPHSAFPEDRAVSPRFPAITPTEEFQDLTFRPSGFSEPGK